MYMYACTHTTYKHTHSTHVYTHMHTHTFIKILLLFNKLALNETICTHVYKIIYMYMYVSMNM